MVSPKELNYPENSQRHHKMFKKLKHKIALFFYGNQIKVLEEENELLTDELLSTSSRLNDVYKKSNERLSYYSSLESDNKQLLESLTDQTEISAELESKYLVLGCKVGKKMLNLEKAILSNNKMYYDYTDKGLRQGEDYSTSLSIALTVNEFGIYPLFHKYSLEDLNNYLLEIDMPKDSLLHLSLLHLHEEKIKAEQKDNELVYKTNRQTNAQKVAEKIKNHKCEM